MPFLPDLFPPDPRTGHWLNRRRLWIYIAIPMLIYDILWIYEAIRGK